MLFTKCWRSAYRWAVPGGAFFFLFAGLLSAADYRAGVARVKITPEGPLWQSGYANRNHPSEGVVTDLWAKALAIQSGSRKPVVIVTLDLVGFPGSLTDEIAAECRKRYGIERASLLFNASHTHAGPVVWSNLVTMFDLPDAEKEKLIAYRAALASKVEALVGQAIGAMQPASISYGVGEAGFAMNRREHTAKGVIIGVNRQGPTDHELPVLRVSGKDGSLIAILFGYACHNTTTGGDFYQISGDWSGFAAIEIEKKHPGTTAMFLMLCGADQNPYPRGTIEIARTHGEEAAAAVEKVLSQSLQPVTGTIRTSYLSTTLAFAPQTRETFEAESKSKVAATARRGQNMVAAIDRGAPVTSTTYPVQAMRFGHSLTLLALGGEDVVGYELRAKKEFRGEPLIVAGYSNDVMCYIPTANMLSEGGYEPVASMVFYGQPGPFAGDVEERVFQAIGKVMRNVR